MILDTNMAKDLETAQSNIKELKDKVREFVMLYGQVSDTTGNLEEN